MMAIITYYNSQMIKDNFHFSKENTEVHISMLPKTKELKDKRQDSTYHSKK